MSADQLQSLQPQGPQRWPWMSALLALVACAIFAIAGSPKSLAFQPNQLLLYSCWRLLTCHLVHWSPQHLLYNTAAFVLLGWFCERINPSRYLVFIGTGAILIPIVACTLHGELRYFAGLSGLAMGQTALMTTLLLSEAIRRRDMVRAIIISSMAFFLITKLIYELLVGHTLFAGTMQGTFVTVPQAHLAGALVGLATGLRVDLLTLITTQNRVGH